MQPWPWNGGTMFADWWIRGQVGWADRMVQWVRGLAGKLPRRVTLAIRCLSGWLKSRNDRNGLLSHLNIHTTAGDSQVNIWYRLFKHQQHSNGKGKPAYRRITHFTFRCLWIGEPGNKMGINSNYFFMTKCDDAINALSSQKAPGTGRKRMSTRVKH